MPQLDKGLEIFLNWQTILLAMGVYIITYIMRTIVENFWKDWRKSKIYSELCLHLSPIVFGAAIAWLAKKFPWPMPIGDSFSVKVMYGGTVGMFCGMVYGRVRVFFAKATGGSVDLPAMPSSEPPASPDAPAPAIPPSAPVPPFPGTQPAVPPSDPTPTPITKPDTPAVKSAPPTK